MFIEFPERRTQRLLSHSESMGCFLNAIQQGLLSACLSTNFPFAILLTQRLHSDSEYVGTFS